MAARRTRVLVVELRRVEPSTSPTWLARSRAGTWTVHGEKADAKQSVRSVLTRAGGIDPDDVVFVEPVGLGWPA